MSKTLLPLIKKPPKAPSKPSLHRRTRSLADSVAQTLKTRHSNPHWEQTLEETFPTMRSTSPPSSPSSPTPIPPSPSSTGLDATAPWSALNPPTPSPTRPSSASSPGPADSRRSSSLSGRCGTSKSPDRRCLERSCCGLFGFRHRR
uniref:Uncharacterized protein n=1 Tax=Ananas comosus var. bracteatus TaxID=296719 RepID=A0A6V7P606_ANACO|nr:unnamed protein product [Ananas comosus var. bracteatus]